jgi:hypothetical protein
MHFVDGELCEQSVSSLESVPKSFVGDIKFSRPFSVSLGYAINGQSLVCSGVVRLFQMGSPAAITRLIVAIVVNSIKGVLGRGRIAHIFKKSFKTILPPVAHGYSSATILGVVRAGWEKTPRLHCEPHAPKPAFFAFIYGCSMFHAVLSQPFSTALNTGITQTRSQIVRLYKLLIPAIALTQPEMVFSDLPFAGTFPCMRKSENNKLPKLLTNQVTFLHRIFLCLLALGTAPGESECYQHSPARGCSYFKLDLAFSHAV